MVVLWRDVYANWHCRRIGKEMKELTIFLSLSAANFVAETMFGGHWELAAERSYFQGIALLTFWICRKIDERTVL
jgi:hypothetical protein